MSHKVILVVLDGLNYQVAQHCLGYLQALVEQQRAALYLVESELPSLSRPLYECLLTGVRPTDSGIISNQVVRRSPPK
ncbi:alkaline phosphatase family protein, partial [Vibrio metoecus]